MFCSTFMKEEGKCVCVCVHACCLCACVCALYCTSLTEFHLSDRLLNANTDISVTP